MLLTLIVAIAFNVQSIYESNNLSLEYDGGTETVFNITQRDGGISLRQDDISAKISDRLNIAGVRNSEVEIDMISSSEAQVRLTLSSSTDTSYNNVVRVVEGNLPLTFTTVNDFEAKGTEIYGDLDVMSLTYSGTTPVVSFNIDDTTVYDNLKADAASSTSEDDQKTIYVWQNKSDTDTYARAFGDDARDDVKKKIIATLSTDNYVSDDDGNRITVSTDEDGNAFTISSARSYVNARNADDYEFDIEETYSNTVVAAYASSSLTGTFIASGIALLFIWVMLVVLFRISGFISGLTIGFSSLFTMFVANFLGFEFTPVTILGLLVTIALGVFIVSNYFQRVKDEIGKGKTIDKANFDGYRKSFVLTLEACGFVFFLALFAFLIGKGLLKTFTGVLLIGSLFDFLLVNYMTKWLEYWLTTSSVFNKEGQAFGLGKNSKVISYLNRRKDVDVNKAGSRRIASYVILGVVAIGCLASYLAIGLTKGGNNIFNYSGDYSNGYRINISYVSDRAIADEDTYINFEDFKNDVCVDHSDLLDGSNIKTYTFNRLETLDEEYNETYTTYISISLYNSFDDAALQAYFQSGTDLEDMIPVDYQADTKFSFVVSKAGNIVNTNLYQYLTIGLIPAFLFAFFLLVHGLYASLAVLFQSSVLYGFGMLSFACGLPFNSLTMFGLMAGLFIAAFCYIPLFARYREAKRGSSIRHPSLAQRVDFINEAKSYARPFYLTGYLTGGVLGLALMCADFTNLFGLGFIFLAVCIIGYFLEDQLLAYNYYNCMKMISFRTSLINKRENKAKKPAFEANEPHETIIPGVND